MASSESSERPRLISAVELVGAGGYDKLKIKQFPSRTPDVNEIVIRVKFAGLNFADLMRR
jgi:NADPH:quinone reductase-like Zn-dependent oxidoreductase